MGTQAQDDRVAAIEVRIGQVLVDPAASHWLRMSLSSALKLDPVDAVNDAELLCELLGERATAIVDRAIEDRPEFSANDE